MLLVLCSCSDTPLGSPAGSHTPVLELTAAQEAAVTALKHPDRSRRGDPLALLSTTRDLLRTTLDCDDVADHLGIPIPSFPTLQDRGFTTVCGSLQGADLFQHPVPSAASPPPPAADPVDDTGSVIIAWLPRDVDIDSTAFHEARSAGLVWMQIVYSGDIVRAPSAPATREASRADVTMLTFTNGTSLGVQYRGPADTRIGWANTVADHRFNISVHTSGDPVTSVALLTGSVDLPT